MRGIFQNLFKSFKRTDNRYEIKAYPDTPVRYDFAFDGSIPSLCSEELLKNPDRGFRGELYFTLGDNVRAYPGNGENPYDRLDRETKLFANDNVGIYQLYIYLFDYYNRPLDKKAFGQLTEYLTELKNRGLRVLLRFAYEYDSAVKKGPKTEQILSHLNQLKGWFSENSKLVNDTVYAMQLGLIGLWGEGHGSRYRHDSAVLLNALFDIIPDSMTLMVRTPALMRGCACKNEHKLSLHDDFLVGIEHEWGIIPFSHPDYGKLLNKCKHSITDGEMPWGRDTTVPNIDHILLIKQCVGYGLRTLSAEHNYKEEGNTYHLERWKNVYLTENELRENGFPYLPAALVDSKISVYDYLGYHLGYLLTADNLKIVSGTAQLDIINCGMSAPLEFKAEMRSNGSVIPIDIDMTDLRQFSKVHIEVPYDGGELAVRFYHERANRLTIRLANDIPYIDGWNIIIK